MNLSIYAINYTKEGMSQVYDTPSFLLTICIYVAEKVMVDAHDSFLLVAIVAIRAILIISVLRVKSVVAIVWQFVATER